MIATRRPRRASPPASCIVSVDLPEPPFWDSTVTTLGFAHEARNLAVHAGYSPDPTTKAVAVPIYQTTSYAFDNTQHGADLFDLKVAGNIYTRIMNPTQDVLEKRVAAMEGGIAGLALASGQAAITYAIQTIAEAGDNIVSASHALRRHLQPVRPHPAAVRHRGALRRLPRPGAFEKLIDGKTKAIFCESVGNPLGNITDFEKLAEIAHATASR
jgi:O-acetylhomoserine (thiol)-lyase